MNEPRAADREIVRERLRASLLANIDPKTADAPARAVLATLRPDGSWADQVYTDTNRENWKAGAHLGRLWAVARAVYTPGAALYGNAAAQKQLLAGLDYWLRVDPRNDNWWHNEIGVPKQIGELLIVMAADAPEPTRQRGTTLMTRSKMTGMTGQNLVWTAQIQIMRGCLTGDDTLVDDAYRRMWQEVRIAGPGQEGIQADDSFHQHGPLLYSGGYGAGFTGDVARFESYAENTRWALAEEKKTILTGYVLDGQQWMVRGGQWDWGVTGRELIRAGKSAAGLTAPVETLAGLPDSPRRSEMAAFAARLKGGDASAPPLVGNRHYWLSDYMSHQRPGYMASARMYSARTLNTDGYINGENKTSHHLADGAFFLSRDGGEFVGIYPVWDWHRIPGTTVEQNTPLDPRHVNHKGTTRFVGGASDGRYGIAAMDLATGELRAHKAWFFFDDEIVCLGAGISCPTANPVVTTLNQTLLRGPVRSSQNANGGAPLSWVWHDGVGYVIPGSGGGTAHLAAQPQTGSLHDVGPWSSAPITKNVFSLWIDHGAGPRDASYEYVVLPGADASRTAEAAAKNPVRIVSNTPALQSVWQPELGILAAAFFRPGSVNAGERTVSVDIPCLVVLARTRGGVRLTVSNPTNEPATANITVSLPLTGENVAPLSGDTSRITLTLPGGLEAGRSVVRELSVRR